MKHNIFEELQKCSDILLKFGGHPMAAGLSLPEENIKAFRKKINEKFAQLLYFSHIL